MPDYPHKASIKNLPVIFQYGTISFFPGGFGSSLAVDPKSNQHFYFLTDRGPMANRGKDKVIVIAPHYCPKIGKFRLEGEELILEELIDLKNSEGQKYSGIPQPHMKKENIRKMQDLLGNKVPFDPNGIDPEGLCIAPDGTFWVAEEYEPALMHFDTTGKLIQKISPYTIPALPEVLKNRKKNRGFEGVTLTPDGKTVVAVLQSTLCNPDCNATEKSRLCRIVTYEPATQKTKQFAYILEKPGLSCSEIAAVSNTVFVLIERDGKPAHKSEYKRIYRIDLEDATDISDPKNSSSGLRFKGKTLEELSAKKLNEAGIRPVSKELVVDLIALDYPYEKPEGLIVLSPTLIGVCHDDDFCIEEDDKNGFRQKVRSDGSINHSEIYFYEIKDMLLRQH